MIIETKPKPAFQTFPNLFYKRIYNLVWISVYDDVNNIVWNSVGFSNWVIINNLIQQENYKNLINQLLYDYEY